MERIGIINGENTDLNEALYICAKALDSVTDLGILAVDSSSRIIIYNKASALHDGLNQDEVIGKQFDSVFSHKEETSIIQKVLVTGEPVIDSEGRYLSVSGTDNTILGSAYPIKRGDEIIGAVAIIRFNNNLRKLLAYTMQLQSQIGELRSEKGNGTRYTFDDISCKSSSMKRVISLAKRAAKIKAPILIYGETGTGKELVAQSICNANLNDDKTFVAINCAAIPETLLESTLFGTTKGAFTGAQDTPGLFEQAGKGTLFLDEINSMPLSLQSKLLRVLQERRVRRVGANKERPVECRIISSCNKPALECVEDGTIRDDLYYRISVICIDIPPLRERKEDIIHLAEEYIHRYSKIYNLDATIMSEGFKQRLLDYEWPGNIRELQHTIESVLVQLEPGEALETYMLPNRMKEKQIDDKPLNNFDEIECADLRKQLSAYERKVIMAALNKTSWNVTQAAKEIGYSRSNLQYRMEKLGITKE